jgi:hypothetical protein
MTKYSNLVHRLRTEWDDVEIDCEAADAIEALEKRVQEQQSYILLLVEKLSQEPTEIKRLEKKH